MPTSYAVLDSGILLVTVQTESLTQQAKTLIADLAEEQVQMLAPALLRYELISVTRKWVYRNLITPEEAQRALNTLLRYPIISVIDDDLLHRAYELAAQFNRPTAYDSQYLAVAERYQCDFWTTDERLFNAVNDRFPHIRWLGDWPIEGESFVADE
jgi:predicted nucleic acid-binding protein